MLHHLQRNLWRRENSIVFVGYAAPGTLARRLIDGVESVHILGEAIPVHARIHTIRGFSAHADADELLRWHEQTAGARTTFLVHGEETAMATFANHLEKTKIVMPEPHSSYDI